MSGINFTTGNEWIDPWAIRNEQPNKVNDRSTSIEELVEGKEDEMEVEDPFVNELAEQMSDNLEIKEWQSVTISQAELDALGQELVPFVGKTPEEIKPLIPKLSSRAKELFQRRNFNITLNQLTSIPSSFEVLKQLKSLDISRNEITQIPENLFTFYTNLNDLNLDFTKVTQLPASIGCCKKLKILSIYRSRLTELPSTIAKLENLTRMLICRAKLTKLPCEIGNLAQLQKLDVSDNQLTELPNEICKLNKIKILDVSKNKLTYLPANLSQLTNLEDLDASHNEIQELPESLDRKHLKNLARTNFENNPLVVPLSAELQEIDASCRLSKEERLKNLGKKNKNEEKEHGPSKIRLNESGYCLLDISVKSNSEDSSGATIKTADLQDIPARKIVHVPRGQKRLQLPSKPSPSLSDEEDW